MNIEQQKRIAKEVLAKVKVLDPRAIIAGGAARDWYFNNLANDIDIFYYHEEGKWCLDNIRREIGLLKVLLGVDHIDVLGFNSAKGQNNAEPEDDFNNYLKNPDIVNVFECTIEGVKFQFIQLKERNVDVNKFAYNMCQAWSNGDWIQTTKKFDLGVKKELLIETGELYSNTNKFKQKMISKFPDYDYISKGEM
jgi:hypothetical protein